MVVLVPVAVFIYVCALVRIFWLNAKIKRRLQTVHPDIWKLYSERPKRKFILWPSQAEFDVAELEYLGDSELQALVESARNALVVYALAFAFAVLVMLFWRFRHVA